MAVFRSVLRMLVMPTATPVARLHVLGDVVIGEMKNTTAVSGFDHRLSVDGIVFAREVRVTALNWADYVFDERYELMSLDDLKDYVTTYRHLPEIPTAADVAISGVSLGEMQVALLKKIEELTLYAIQLSDQNAELQKRLTNVEGKLK